jgi:hypothetical protein
MVNIARKTKKRYAYNQKRKSYKNKNINKHKNKHKNIQTGGKANIIEEEKIIINVMYEQISKLDNIKEMRVLKENTEYIIENADLTSYTEYISNAPQIDLIIPNPINNKTYLIIMYDPDAPNGKDSKDSSNNHIYIHWMFTRKYTQTIPTAQTAPTDTIILPYTTPSPPSGMHRYEFHIYDMNVIPANININILKNIKQDSEQVQTIITKLEPYKLKSNNMLFTVAADLK